MKNTLDKIIDKTVPITFVINSALINTYLGFNEMKEQGLNLESNPLVEFTQEYFGSPVYGLAIPKVFGILLSVYGAGRLGEQGKVKGSHLMYGVGAYWVLESMNYVHNLVF